MIVFVKVRRKQPQPCMFLDSCPSPCDWCKTHDYSEACVPMLNKTVQEMRVELQKARNAAADFSEAFKDMLKRNAKIAAQGKTIADGEKTMTLQELGRKICDTYTDMDCDTVCPARDYCRAGHNGMLDWLRKVVSND